MRIEHFTGTNVHGYLRFDVAFNEDVTMLHGINGAGKTTAVRAIMALLNPDLYWLSSTDFQSISVRFSYGEHTYEISARREVESILITLSGTAEQYQEEINSRIPLRYIEFFTERSRSRRAHGLLDEELERNLPPDVDLSVVRAIREFPTPTFLGLERTTLPPDSGLEDLPPSERNRRLGLYSRLWLEASINEAVRLAKDAYETRYRKPQNELMTRLRSKIILSLFQKAARINRIEIPFKGEPSKYTEMQARIISVLRQLQLVSDGDIRREVEPFFKEIITVANELSVGLNDHDRSDKDRTNLIMKWVELESPLRAIENVVTLTQEYEADDNKNFLPFKNYQDILNGFFRDSGKELRFSDTGNIEVLLPNGELGDVGQLSSGERQLFVLITHLAFNKKTREADILIIDEPELSLHLKWQQRFVKAIIETSASTQLILATHSPSIIGKYRNKCVSLNAKKRPTAIR